MLNGDWILSKTISVRTSFNAKKRQKETNVCLLFSLTKQIVLYIYIYIYIY